MKIQRSTFYTLHREDIKKIPYIGNDFKIIIS